MELKIPLSDQFFRNIEDPAEAAHSLIGKILWSREPDSNDLCAGQIVETEGYGPMDEACHARHWRKTSRNLVLFSGGGHIYAYQCHVHVLVNITFGLEDMPVCVLLRSIAPILGSERMICRRILARTLKGHSAGDLRSHVQTIGKGPGNLTVALGISKDSYGASVYNGNQGIWITNNFTTEEEFLTITRTLSLPDKEKIPASPQTWLPEDRLWNEWHIEKSPRIGIANSGEAAKLLWRFYVQHHKAVSTGVMIWPNDMKPREPKASRSNTAQSKSSKRKRDGRRQDSPPKKNIGKRKFVEDSNSGLHVQLDKPALQVTVTSAMKRSAESSSSNAKFDYVSEGDVNHVST